MTTQGAAAQAVYQGPGEGNAVWALGGLMTFTLPAESGAGFGVLDVTQPPGTATPLHIHQREAEAFYLLEGTMSYQAGEARYALTAGSFLYLPPRLPHRFRITGDRPARFLALTLPAGLEALYAEVGRPATERTLPGAPPPDEIARWLELAPRYGIQVVGPPLPAEPAAEGAA
jgi:quercetin dioxygenase-like cupin family protein